MLNSAGKSFIIVLYFAGSACGWSQISGRYTPGSFEALLADMTGTNSTTSEFSATKEIALVTPDSTIGVSAVNRLATREESEAEIHGALREIFAARNESVIGARAAELYLASLTTSDAREVSKTMQAEFEGTPVGRVATLQLLQTALDRNEPQELQRNLLLLVEEASPALHDLRLIKVLVASVDALGHPDAALKFQNRRLEPEAVEQIKFVINNPNLWPTVCAAPVREFFAVDYAGGESQFETAGRRVADCMNVLLLRSESSSASPADVDSVVQAVIDGLVFRANKANSYFSVERRPPSVITEVASACIELLQRTIELNPEFAAIYSRTVIRHANSLDNVGLDALAEPFYRKTLEWATNLDVRSTAVVDLARLLSDEWGAHFEALELLTRESASGTRPAVYIATAKLQYQLGYFDDALHSLENFIRVEQDAERINKARFILGQTLRRLGRDEEARAVWLDVLERTKNDSLRQMIKDVFDGEFDRLP